MTPPAISRKAVASLALIPVVVGLTAIAWLFGLPGRTLFEDIVILAFFAFVVRLLPGQVTQSAGWNSEGRPWRRLLALMATLLAIAITLAACIFVPVVLYVTEAQRRAQCYRQLRELAEAMHLYHDDHRTLPPHALFGGDGQPLLSWRVLLLPYLGDETLYREFRLDEPWDSPHNLDLLPRMPAVYAPPGRWTGAGPHSTFYQVFVGKGAAFDGRKGMKLPDNFPDGTYNTILIVEAGEAVPWTKPEDLPYAADRPLPKLGGLGFRQVFLAASAAGSVHLINRDTSEATLRAAVSRDGGDAPGSEW